METHWKRYNIFISSTFKDMDVERDVIKFEIIPDINRRFRSRGVELQAIDLRLGVNTEGMDEESSAGKVLDVCAKGIDSARPFFIGLVGSRYGWIPPLERWKDFLRSLPPQDREMMQESFGASVTELEMIYGALNEKSLADGHILFYLRDEASYDGLPEDRKALYVDNDGYHKQRLEELRKKIVEILGRGGADDRCTTYRLHYDTRSGQFNAQQFKALLTEQISEEIEKELGSREACLTLWEEEKRSVEAVFASSVSRLVPLSCYAQDLNNAVLQSTITGAGLSSELAWRYRKLSGDSKRICLCAIAGRSSRTSTERGILALWCCELASRAGDSQLSETELMDSSKTPLTQLCTLFRSLVEKASSKGYRVSVFLDDLQNLGAAVGAISASLSDKVDALLCYRGSDCSELLRRNPQLQLVSRSGAVSGQDLDSLVKHLQQLFFLELPSSMGGDIMSGSSPLQICTVFRLFESLDSSDFSRIRNSGDNQIQAINNYLTAIWTELKQCSEARDLFSWTLDKMIANLRLDTRWRDIFLLLSAAPGGMRQRDLEQLGSQFWDETVFLRLCTLLGEFVSEDAVHHVWSCTAGLEPGDAAQRSALYGAAAHYFSGLPQDDEMALNLLAVFVVLSEDPSLASLLVFPDEDYIFSDKTRLYFRGPGQLFLHALRPRFLHYLDLLDQSTAIYFIYNTERSLWNKGDNDEFAACIVDKLLTFDIGAMNAEEALVVGALLLGYPDANPQQSRKLALEALLRAKKLGVRAESNVDVGLVNLLAQLADEARKNKDKAAEKKYSQMLAEMAGERKDAEGSGASEGGSERKEPRLKRKAGADFMTAAFQPQAALQMKIANSLKSELSAGKGLKAVFGSRRKRRDSEVLRLAGELTQSADNFVASWELDQNSARMYTLLLHAYNASIGAYMETGAYDRALEASFRLLMNVRYATYGNLDSAANLGVVLRAHMAVISSASVAYSELIDYGQDGPANLESLFFFSVVSSTGAVVNRLATVAPDDKLLDEFYRITKGIPVFNEMMVNTKDEEVDIVEICETIREIGEDLGLEWKIG